MSTGALRARVLRFIGRDVVVLHHLLDGLDGHSDASVRQILDELVAKRVLLRRKRLMPDALGRRRMLLTFRVNTNTVSFEEVEAMIPMEQFADPKRGREAMIEMLWRTAGRTPLAKRDDHEC